MQVNAALRMSRVPRGVVAASRLVLSSSVGLASFGARRTRSVLPRSTAAVGVGRPSFGGQRTVWAGSRSGVLGAAGASALALSATVARAALPAWSAQAPRSTVRSLSAAALSASRGHSQPQCVPLSPASRETSSCCSVVAGKLTGVNVSHFGCGSAKSAPNPSVKRTAPGVPWAAAYLKR
jgi:hypothetical protein